MVDRANAGLYVMVYAMSYISLNNIYRMIYGTPFLRSDYGGWTMDTSVILLYAVARCTMFGFAYSDGAKHK